MKMIPVMQKLTLFMHPEMSTSLIFLRVEIVVYESRYQMGYRGLKILERLCSQEIHESEFLLVCLINRQFKFVVYHCELNLMHSKTSSTSLTGSFISVISILWVFFRPSTIRLRLMFSTKVKARPRSLCRPVRPTLCKYMSRSMSASFSEYLGGPTFITKQAFLMLIFPAMMLVANRMLVSLFLNFAKISCVSLMLIYTCLLSSYFLPAMMPTVRACRYSDSSEVKSEAQNRKGMYSCFKVVMEFFDLLDGIKEDKYLRSIRAFIKFFKDCSNNVLMHLGLCLDCFVIILDAIQLLNYLILIDVKFYKVLGVLLVKVQKLLFHSRRTCYDIWSVGLSDFQYLGQGLFFLLEDIIDLVDRDEFTVIEFKVASLTSVQKGFRHSNNDVTELMSLFVESSNFEFQFF